MIATTFLQHVPIWVFPLLVGLIVLGWSQTRSRTMPLWRALVLPLVMTVMSPLAVLASAGVLLVALPAWLLGWLLPVVLAGHRARPARLQIDAGRITVPGSWWPMVLILSIFVARFVVGATLGVNPALADSAALSLAIGLVYGLLSGAFIARVIPLLRSFKLAQTIRPGVVVPH